MNKYITEVLGTFFLVFTVCMTTSAAGAGNLAPLAIGAVLMVMVYAGGHISGAHYNPAVSFGVMIRGKANLAETIKYWVSQILGAVIAAYVAKYLLGGGGSGNENIDTAKSLIAEIIGTFALVTVVLNVATSTKNAGNNYYGVAIGFTVLAMAYTLGGISGGAFNPAVALGKTLIGDFSWTSIWIYLVGNLVGALLAGLLYKVMNPDEK